MNSTEKRSSTYSRDCMPAIHMRVLELGLPSAGRLWITSMEQSRASQALWVDHHLELNCLFKGTVKYAGLPLMRHCFSKGALYYLSLDMMRC